MTELRDEATEAFSATPGGSPPKELLAPGTVLGGQWSVESLLAHGGMGSVYLGHDSVLDRKVALKVLPLSLAEEPDSLARFEREARLMAKLDHPNLVPIFNTGRHQGRPFIVMKYLEGMTLRDTLRELPPPWTPTEIARLFDQLCAGLGSIHEQGFVHRDIKPTNLFLAPSGNLTILDFGILREAASGDLTTTGVAVGTPTYMSPEQATGRGALDARSDLYAAGLVLEELLLGTSARWHRERGVDPRPEALPALPALPVAWTSVLERVLAWDPAKRFRTASELAKAVHAAAANPNAGSTPARTPGGSPWGRRAMPAAAGALAALALASGAVALFGRPTPRSPAPQLEVVAPVLRAEPMAPIPAPAPLAVVPPKDEHRPRMTRASARGKLRVVTHQGRDLTWANVTLDGIPQGSTPVDLSVSPGSHRVRVERPGFRTLERTVQVGEGRPTVVSLELRR